MAEEDHRDSHKPYSVPATDDVVEYDQMGSEWLYYCMRIVSTSPAAVASWLHLICGAISLHTSFVCSNTISRSAACRAVIHNLTQSDKKCKDMLHTSTSCYGTLLHNIKTKSKVKNYLCGSIEEQLVVFLLIVGQNLKNRVVSYLLCRSGETITRYFHNILLAVITLEDVYIKLSNGEEIQPTILNHRFFHFFKDSLGAIDGTHVRVKVSQTDASRYRGRKNWPTQNVLAACTFDLKFTYILASREGSAADSRILHNALIRDEPLIIPDGKFYLGDAGFRLTSKVLTPYGRTRYNLKEFSRHSPETPEELFNHRHSSLRNTIERAFGILKKRFPIMASGSECMYSCDTMTNIILACGVLHNFLLTEACGEVALSAEDIGDADFGVRYSHIDSQIQRENHSGLDYIRGRELRDRIANDIGVEYCASMNCT